MCRIFVPTKTNKMKSQAQKFITDKKRVGLDDSQILDLVNNYLLNKINDKNLELCLEIKKQLK